MGRTPKQKSYLVKRRGQQVRISKEDLKKRNQEIVEEFRSADEDQRGRLLSEYIDLNRSFVTYFPKFRGDFRDEIINTFVSTLPQYFLSYDPAKGTEINSYLAMFAKKNAVREFLYLLPTVMHNRFYRDETGRMVVEKAQVFSLDNLGGAVLDGGEGELSEERGLDYLLGQTVYRDFLHSNRDAALEFLEGIDTYSHLFEGLTAEIVKDFENGLRWNEVRRKYRLTGDRFLSLVLGIRMQIRRIRKEDGDADIRFLTRRERADRNQGRRAGRRRAAGGVPGGKPGAGGAASIPGGLDRLFESYGSGDEAEGAQGPFYTEEDGPATWGQEGEAA